MSGSRLPGDSESNDRHKIDTRAEARLPDDLAERLENYVDEKGETKSDVIRDALDEYLPQQQTPEFVLPKDPDLAAAYRTLARRDDRRILSHSKALDILSRTSHPNTDKELIRDDVLKPLEKGGLIGIDNGHVAVHPLTPIEEIADQTEAPSTDELAEAEPVRADGGTSQ